MSKVWRYGDHIDTDVIIPARYLNIADFKELAEHAMEDAKENLEINFAANVQPGDYIVADSFARIFYRNAINIGLPVLEIGADVEKIEPGDEIDVDINKGEIKILNKNITIKTKPLPEFIQHIADCGGLINYIKGENK